MGSFPGGNFPTDTGPQQSFGGKLELTFAVLSDVGNRVARQFGLVFTIDEAVRGSHQRVGANLPAFNDNDSWELPMAGTFLVDQSGTVRLAFVDPDFASPAIWRQCP